MRGVPILLARYGGRFYELYNVDEDHSYDEALLVGERLYRRDLATGDSIVVFADTVVDRIAGTYARFHPDERPLGPDDEGDANPETSATSQIDIIDVIGPYASFAYHVDVDIAGSAPWHATRHGVLDLRSGTPTTVAELFGDVVGRAIADSGRRRYEFVRDSILADRAAASGESRGAEALRRFHFDERSFSLSSLDGKPAVTFKIPGRGEGVAGNGIELDPIVADETPWWRGVAPSAAVETPDGGDRWNHRSYRVLARYDSLGDAARLFLADSSSREWSIATIAGPIHDVTWLDDPPVANIDRANLVRAFNTAATYDQSSRVALRATSHALRPVAYAPDQTGPRKPARNLRAHDAGTREQHGSRVRRRHPVDHGQDGRDRGLPAQPSQRGDRIDRSRGFSAADSPRRSRVDESERQLRRPNVHGSRRSR